MKLVPVKLVAAGEGSIPLIKLFFRKASVARLALNFFTLAI